MIFESIRRTLALAAVIAAASACSVNPLSPGMVAAPNVPSTFLGRCVEIQGSVAVATRDVTFEVWDGATIDGDIISLIVNGVTVLSEFELDGPLNKKAVPVRLANNGYNYVLLFAHNTGTLFPNTAALSVDDGTTVQQLVISANLTTNGAYHITLGNVPAPQIGGSTCG